MPTQRPQLKPALRRVWRDGSTLQLGVDPARAVVIGGLDAGSARLLESLDGSRDLRGLTVGAARLGVDADRLQELLGLLSKAGVLEDAAADHRALAGLGRPERDRLEPDVAAASLLRDGAESGVDVLARRRHQVVHVLGAGRVGASVVSLLAAAGVGTLVAEDAGHDPAGRRRARRCGAVRRRRAAPGRGAAGGAQGGTVGEGHVAGRPDRRGPRGARRRAGVGPPHPRPAAAGRDPAPGRPGPRDHRRGRPAGAAGPVLLPALPRPAPHRPRPGLAAHRGPAQRRVPAAHRGVRLGAGHGRGRARSAFRCWPTSTATLLRRPSTAPSRSPRPTVGCGAGRGPRTRPAAARGAT